MRKILFVLFFFCAGEAYGVTYYVSPPPSGNSGNPCTPNSPTTRRATITGGAQCLSGGDTLVVGNGIYDENLDDILPSGTTSAPTVVRAENRRQAILQPTVKRLNGNIIRIGWMSTSTGTVKHDINIQGLVLDGALLPVGTRTTGVEVADSAGGPTLSGTYNIIIDDLEIRHFPDANRCSSGDDLSLGLNTGGSERDVTIRNSHIWDIGRDSQPDPGACTGGQHYYYGYCLYLSGARHTVEKNELDHCTAFSIHNFSAHTSPDGANIFRNNFIHDNGDSLLTACGGSNNQVYNNIFLNNGFYGYWARGNGAIVLGGTCSGFASSNNFVYNNTIVGDRGTCIRMGYSGAGVPSDNNTIRNNLCYNNSPNEITVANGSGNTINTNFCSGDGCSVLGDPLFVTASPTIATDFQLQSTSPAKDAGATITFTPNTDYGGNQRLQGAAQDIGAWEFGGSVAPPVRLPQEVLRWKMNEGSGTTTFDSTNNGYTGTIVGSLVWTPGREGLHALTFDGATTYVENTTLQWPPNTPMTVAVWVNAPNDTNNSGTFKLGNLERPNRFGLHLPWGGDRMIKCDYGNDLGGGHVETSMSPYIGRWVHVACTSDGTSQMTLYVNGKAVLSSGPTTAPTLQLTGITVGRSFFPPSSTYYHTGGLDDFRLFSIMLTPEQVMQVYLEDAGIHRHNELGLR